jgi:hypothetical protein
MVHGELRGALKLQDEQMLFAMVDHPCESPALFLELTLPKGGALPIDPSKSLRVLPVVGFLNGLIVAHFSAGLLTCLLTVFGFQVLFFILDFLWGWDW